MRRPSKPDSLTILLVRPRLIGDVILTTPAVRALRRRFPDAALLYLVESLAAPVVADNPHLNEVIVMERRRGWRRWLEDLRLARRLRRRAIDVAVDFHGGPRSAWLTWATRARMRVGYDVADRRWMYTHVVPKPRGYAPRHSVRNQWDLLAPIDEAFRNPPDRTADRIEMPVSRAAREAVAMRLAALGVAAGDHLVVVHGAAGNEFRRWPEASFARVVASIAARGHDWVVAVVGAAGDESIVADIVQRARAQSAESQRIVSIIGWRLDQLRALMDRATLFVGGDSGPMHVAAATDVPIVAIFGPTTPETWAPWRPEHLPLATIDVGALPCRPCDQRVCEPGDFRCLRKLAPETVVQAAAALLERAR
ncbi:MAG TPA: putative lipopolysaccharide heptosyltransferase III [Vicinamibacterales bacterium]|nr:putative lipopolysaccharide heptosyltransferase III [Vicinamibacterales bacterium]